MVNYKYKFNMITYLNSSNLVFKVNYSIKLKFFFEFYLYTVLSILINLFYTNFLEIYRFDLSDIFIEKYCDYF